MDLQLLFKRYLHHKQFINSSRFEKEMVVTCDKSALGVRRVLLINHRTKSRPRHLLLRHTPPYIAAHAHAHKKKESVSAFAACAQMSAGRITPVSTNAAAGFMRRHDISARLAPPASLASALTER